MTLSFFSETLIDKYTFADIYYMYYREVMYNLIDNDVKGCRNVNIGTLNHIEESEQEFINRRILAYKKEFQKKIEVVENN